MNDTKTRDKHGREIKIGDVLKVYHFTAALRREKMYMYKQVVSLKQCGGAKLMDGSTIPFVDYFKVSHLEMTDEYYLIGMNEGVLCDYEIVQGAHDFYKERPKVK